MLIDGPTSVNSGVSCNFSAIPRGGYDPPGNHWDVDGTILDGQSTGAIDAVFEDGIHAVSVSATDGQGYSAASTIYVNSQTVGRGCERT